MRHNQSMAGKCLSAWFWHPTFFGANSSESLDLARWVSFVGKLYVVITAFASSLILSILPTNRFSSVSLNFLLFLKLLSFHSAQASFPQLFSIQKKNKTHRAQTLPGARGEISPWQLLSPRWARFFFWKRMNCLKFYIITQVIWVTKNDLWILRE